MGAIFSALMFSKTAALPQFSYSVRIKSSVKSQCKHQTCNHIYSQLSNCIKCSSINAYLPWHHNVILILLVPKQHFNDSFESNVCLGVKEETDHLTILFTEGTEIVNVWNISSKV